jgi:hypothetical protein
MAAIFERPQLLIDPTAEPNATKAIQSLDRRIFRHPEIYAQTLDSLGSTATSASVELHDVDEERGLDQLGTKRLTPEKLILTFFSKRYDYDASFDPETEQALSQDPVHTDLQAAFRETRSLYKRKGVMGSYLAPNPEAPDARDAVRRHRLSFYISRVADWRAAIDENAKLPSAV